MHPLALIFGILILPNVYTLKCHKCIPESGGSCKEISEKICPPTGYMCSAQKITSFAGSLKLAAVHMKTCILADECVDGSVNFGISRNIVTSKCCSSDLCNTEEAPEPKKSTPNGNKCYHCDNKSCTATLNCEGNEDHCITKTVVQKGETKVVKGCASKQICQHTNNAQIKAAIGGDSSCCQGNFCNSASSTSAGLLLLVPTLISLVMLS